LLQHIDLKESSLETDLPIYIGPDAIPNLIGYCESRHLDRFTIVADQNTYPVLAKSVEQALKSHGFGVNTVILTGQEIIADEYYIMQVLLQADRTERTYLAVGSGTITDIVRIVSHRTRTSFISIPTAPSVDGFTSSTCSLVIGRLKKTVGAQPPAAIFADLPTLCSAPRPMIAAGFGDILGKYTSLADWNLGHLLWDEPFNEQAAQRTERALQGCVGDAPEIGQGSEEGIRSLIQGLCESGLSMAEAGSSRPAAGAEHYLSHFLELKLLRENRPAILHGAKVGVACILMAGYYERIRQLTRPQVAERLEAATLPDRAQEIRRIQAAYPSIADQVIAEQAPFLEMSEQAIRLLKYKIVDCWEVILEIASTVPSARELGDMLRQVGGAVDARTLGLSDEEVAQGMEYSHYFRNRFTVLKLSRIIRIQ
jgi:glycerol-1-phosphate dehydrogenase [NAD(P)+]